MRHPRIVGGSVSVGTERPVQHQLIHLVIMDVMCSIRVHMCECLYYDFLYEHFFVRFVDAWTRRASQAISKINRA